MVGVDVVVDVVDDVDMPSEGTQVEVRSQSSMRNGERLSDSLSILKQRGIGKKKILELKRNRKNGRKRILQ